MRFRAPATTANVGVTAVNFQRNIRRRNERSYWAPVSRQYNL